MGKSEGDGQRIMTGERVNLKCRKDSLQMWYEKFENVSRACLGVWICREFKGLRKEI